MKTYLLTAVGVIFLSVIVSLVIPEGKMNKSITFVMRMACIFVLIQPLTGIFKIKSSSDGEVFYDYEYICGVYAENQSDQLEKKLADEFSAECTCSIEIVHDNGVFRAESVT
ncbi:MAG: stage III sporulation protein AF, partial [Clostridia bacterium]|nr:stage III sporulation protein AF [Clostridia bacterium]